METNNTKVWLITGTSTSLGREYGDRAVITARKPEQAKAAQAMIQVVESENPPLRLPLGADAVDGIEQKLEAVKANIDAWQKVAINKAYEGVSVGTVGG